MAKFKLKEFMKTRIEPKLNPPPVTTTPGERIRQAIKSRLPRLGKET